MLAPRSLLLASLLTALQFALSVDAKGGGKGSKGTKGTKGSKGPKKSKTKYKPVKYRDHGKCYDAERVQVPCPASKSIGLIIGIVVGVIVVILIIAVAVWYFKRRSQKKKKGLGVASRGIDDASSDRESIVPLVYEETKEKGYDYKDKSADV